MTAKLWAGVFSADVDAEVLDYTETTGVDVRLVRFDLWQTLAHVLMLNRADVVEDADAAAVLDALLSLMDMHDRGELRLEAELEDVHLNLESMVIDRAGASAGGRMHTARSRNDQVVTDTRMYLRQVVLDLVDELAGFAGDLCSAAREELSVVIPGYTHSQPAQPITAGYWRTAHASALLRDLGRLQDAYGRIDLSPLGACALAGTSFPIDRDYTADLLGFGGVLTSALDATSTRDFVQELAAVLAVLATNLTRLSEEIVVFSGHEYGLFRVADSMATGSSIMPQKKNPVVAELARARAGRAYGALVQVLVIAKGVGLGYSCDLQEDKPVMWDAIDTVGATVRLMRLQMTNLRIDAERGLALCYQNFSTATELANLLVSDEGLPFRSAHRITGEVVAALAAAGATLRDGDLVAKLLLERDVSVSPTTLTATVAPLSAVQRSTSAGGTSAAATTSTLVEIESDIAAVSGWCRQRRERLAAAERQTVDAARSFTENRGRTHG
jgi:argininosuccinate lyase